MPQTSDMTVPLLDLRPQLEEVGQQIKDAVCAVIDSAQYVMGRPVYELEEQLADAIGVRHAVAVSSGSDALLMSLMALDVGPGDVVLTSPYSFFATAGAIARLHATPAFVDIEPQTYNLDPRALAAWFEDHPRLAARVKAVMPVHLFGQCADMDPILRVARRFGAAVVEDAAQAIAAGYPSQDGVRQAGGMGTVGCFSFFPTKNLGAMGDGGLVVTSDEHLAHKLRRLRQHGASPKYYHSLVGGNFRLDPVQAAVLLAKLPCLDDWTDRRRVNAAYYDERLDDGVVGLPAVAWHRSHHVYNQYVVSVQRRDDLRSFLAQHGVHTEVYYPLPLHLQECFRGLGYRAGDFPRSEFAAAHSLALPVYPGLTPDMQDHVIEKIGAFYA